MRSRLLIPLVALAGLIVSLSAPTPAYAQAGPTSCTTGNVDVTEYMAPDCGGGACPSIASSSVGDGYSHIGNVTNSVEWLPGSNRFKQNSNEIHFLYELTPGSILFLQDTIWDGFFCTDGREAMYRVNYNPPQWGGELTPRVRSCGSVHTYSTRISTFAYDPAVETNVDMPLNSCFVPGQSDGVSTNTNQLFFQGPAMCNGKEVDAIGLHSLSGAGAGEVLFFCRGFGLCAFYQNLDFSAEENDPRTWTAETDVCNLQPRLKPAPYYLYPINGLANGDTGAIFNDLINQGYQPQCSTPKFQVEAQTGGAIDRLIALISPNTIEKEISGSLTYDVAGSKVPVLRDNKPISTLFGSLEDYWGYLHNPDGELTRENLIASSPIYYLLSLQEQCVKKVEILETIESMCNQLADPSTCALYQPIPDYPEYNTKTMLEAYRGSGLSCKDVGSENLSDNNRRILAALGNVPLYLDKSFRLAFLVITTELKDDGPTAFFNFLRRDGRNASPRDEVRVVAFKLPDFGTNKPSTDTAYTDPLQLTRDVLTSPEIQERNQIDIEEIKQQLRSGSAGGGAIDCGGEACADPLTQALIQIVNNGGQACEANPEDLKYEPANTIESLGALADEPGTEFADGNNPSFELFRAPEDQVNNPQRATFNFISQIRLGATGRSDTKVKTYLVYPMGYELATVENSLMAFFNTTWADRAASDPTAREYFKLNGVTIDFRGGTAEHTFTDPEEPCSPDPETGVIVCGSKTATAELSANANDAEPRILGGRLGYLTRMVQLTVNDFGTKIYNFVASCRTTEDFLLGRCGGGTETIGTQPPLAGGGDLNPVARCEAGSARITSGELAVHIPSPANPNCNMFVADEHDIPNWKNPNDPVKSCEELFSYVACTYPNTLIQNTVNTAGQFDPNSSVTACQFVVDKARANGISPRFALAMWGEESGFSSYRVPDFGVISAPAQDLGLQTTAFFNTANNQTSFLSFLERYSGDTNNQFCNNKFFPARLRDFYNHLGP